MMFKGSYTALVTPMNAGEIDLDALADLVEWQIEQGTHGLVPAGTTGESPTLSHSEHDRVVSATVEAAAGRVPVIGGAGSNNTIETVRLVQAAKDAGCDAALVVTPYYNKPTQRGLIAHYTAAAEIGLPIIIYNIPGRSVVDMSPATMGELAKLDAIVGVKDSTGDITRVSHQRATCGTDFVQLSGEDASALGFNAHGGHGAISVTANVAPALCSEFQSATLEGDYVRALELQDRLMPLHTAIFQEPGLVGAKYGLSLLGKVREDVRSPLTALEDGTRLAIKDAMIAAGVLT